MIQHIVLLKWKPGTTDAQINEAFGGARQRVDAALGGLLESLSIEPDLLEVPPSH